MPLRWGDSQDGGVVKGEVPQSCGALDQTTTALLENRPSIMHGNARICNRNYFPAPRTPREGGARDRFVGSLEHWKAPGAPITAALHCAGEAARSVRREGLRTRGRGPPRGWLPSAPPTAIPA